MRLSTDSDRDEANGVATIRAAVEAGITVLDTAHAYAPDETLLGHNERLLAGALRGTDGTSVRVVTKGGMTRAGGGWVPDGRAKAIAADCEASLVALDGLGIDLYLLHVPDPRTPWRTSVRALAKLVDDGLVTRAGLSNVNLAQLAEAVELAPISAVEVALSPLDDRAIRGGLLDRCEQLGIMLIAHSPLGGPRRAATLRRRESLARAAEAHGATVEEVALAWVLGLSANVVAIPGARRPETARSAAGAATLELTAAERDAILPRRSSSAPRPGTARARASDSEVVLMMGIPGAGKSRLAQEYIDRGYARLNRDERGGSLKLIVDALDEQLSGGARRIVLDNTYATRAARSYVIETAAAHGAATTCVWLDTPLDQAQVNLVERILDHFGRLPAPEELRAAGRTDAGLMPPTSQMRVLRELEPPSSDEGFAAIENVPFVRLPTRPESQAGVVVAARALEQLAFSTPDPDAPHLLFDWRPDGAPEDLVEPAAALAARIRGPVATAICPHGGGPPRCWCRPPLPGLPLAFAREHGVDLARSTLVGASPAHGTLARALGMRYLAA